MDERSSGASALFLRFETENFAFALKYCIVIVMYKCEGENDEVREIIGSIAI